jgi:TorA maturation chaperone TorD
MELSALERAVEIAGGQSALARKLGLKQANVWHWLNRAEHVPAEQAIAIEAATNGAVSRAELRPDLFAADKSDLSEEDQIRAQCYGLLASLLASPPAVGDLARLAMLDGDGSAFGIALTGIATQASGADAAAVHDEYQALFIGLVRGELAPYASYYRTGFLHEKPLARVRADMERLGLARVDTVSEPEDHIAVLCEIMQTLISDPAIDLAEQRRFFDAHLAPWVDGLFRDLEKAEAARFYKAVGRFGRVFMTIEQEAFALAA